MRTYSCISGAAPGVVGKNLLLTTKILRVVLWIPFSESANAL